MPPSFTPRHRRTVMVSSLVSTGDSTGVSTGIPTGVSDARKSALWGRVGWG